MRALLALAVAPALFGAGVSVRFNPLYPDIGPFPSDVLRLAMPAPDCATHPTDCAEIALINQLDGFNPNARLRVRFSGRINPDTLRDGIHYIALDDLAATNINQIIYDPQTDTAYAKPDRVLAQGRRYALVITAGVRDAAGDPVAPDPAFSLCVQNPYNSYCSDLAAAMARLGPQQVIGASLFTVMNATRWLEEAREQDRNTPPVVSVGQSFRVADLAAITLNEQVGSGKFVDISIPVDPTLFSGLGRVVFGSFDSPSHLSEEQLIGPDPAERRRAERIQFHMLLPDQPAPASGYPVVMFGHGLGDSSFGGPTAVSPILARAGFATIAITAVGHGFGPQSAVTLTDRSGAATRLTAGGRGVDRNGDGSIEPYEGCLIATPVAAGLRDCLRQTALDLAQLVRVIQAGLPEIDSTRIYYLGESLGGLYGTLFTAVEPNVRAAVLNVPGGSVVDIAYWSQSYGGLAADFLSMRTPPLLNMGTGFNANYVLRDKPAKVNDVPGAIAIQNMFEMAEWLQAPGDPLSFAPKLAGKPVLWQVAKGDKTVPNPASSNLIRAAGMLGSTWLYRHDIARRAAAGFGLSLPENPHGFLTFFLGLDANGIQLPSLAALAIGYAAQQQIADYFTGDGAVNPDPNTALQTLGLTVFEQPKELPEEP